MLVSSANLNPGNVLIDLETFGIGATVNPLTIGSATFSSTTPLAIEDISTFGASGTAVTGKVLRSNGAQALGSGNYSSIRLDFSTPMSEIGLGWFDPNFSGNALLVFNALNQLLESAPVATGPAGGGFAAFVGIARTGNDIAYAIASVSAPGDVYGIDNVSFGAHAVTAVPLPAAGLLLAPVLLALGGTLRRGSPSRFRS